MGFVEKCTYKREMDGERLEVDALALTVQNGISGSWFEGGEALLQITLMEKEAQIRGMIHQADGFCIQRFKENILLSGVDLSSFIVGDQLEVGSAILEITIAGKKCYSECPVYVRSGPCGLDRHAAFAKVVQSGTVSVGDPAKKRT